MLKLLAARIAGGQVPGFSEYRVVYLDTANVGVEDSRAMLESLFAGLRDNSNVVVLIDNLGQLLQRSGGTNKPLIRSISSRRGMFLVGTMSDIEYQEQIGNDALMLDHFYRVRWTGPDSIELADIVRHFAESQSRDAGIAVSPEVLHRLTVLTSAFLVSDAEPSRSIEVLRRIFDRRRFETTLGRPSNQPIQVEEVANEIAHKSGISAETVLGQSLHRDFHAILSASVVGQTDAVRETAIELELISAGLNDPYKPASVLMFAGLTGVGKSELAKQIARIYSPTGSLKVYPMGNYTEPHSVSGLIGVPPGYVGHEDGGRLVNDLLADPYSVFLLDEAEKCHPNVWKPFLTLFDEGWIIVQRGRKAFGNRAIFILTTNAGDRSIAQLVRSDKSPQEVADHVRKTLSRVRHEQSSQPVFPPQFLSRIRRILVFRPLDLETMRGITQIFLNKMATKWLRSRSKTVSVVAEVASKIAEESHRLNELSNGEEGGRIVQKLISELVEYQILRQAMKFPEQYDACQTISVTLHTTDPVAVNVSFE